MSAVTYIAGGIVTFQVLWLALITGPAYGLGLWLGARMFGLANAEVFRRVCDAAEKAG